MALRRTRRARRPVPVPRLDLGLSDDEQDESRADLAPAVSPAYVEMGDRITHLAMELGSFAAHVRESGVSSALLQREHHAETLATLRSIEGACIATRENSASIVSLLRIVVMLVCILFAPVCLRAVLY